MPLAALTMLGMRCASGGLARLHNSELLLFSIGGPELGGWRRFGLDRLLIEQVGDVAAWAASSSAPSSVFVSACSASTRGANIPRSLTERELGDAAEGDLEKRLPARGAVLWKPLGERRPADLVGGRSGGYLSRFGVCRGGAELWSLALSLWRDLWSGAS